MAQAPVQEKLQWDTLPVGDTRPAMKAGVPFLWIFPIFFGPALIIVFTYWIWMLLAIPILWLVVGACYAGNFNRPFQWGIWIFSGAAFANWMPWGGISIDPHGSPSETDFYV